jgi:hypothetical protein
MINLYSLPHSLYIDTLCLVSKAAKTIIIFISVACHQLPETKNSSCSPTSYALLSSSTNDTEYFPVSKKRPIQPLRQKNLMTVFVTWINQSWAFGMLFIHSKNMIFGLVLFKSKIYKIDNKNPVGPQMRIRHAPDREKSIQVQKQRIILPFYYPLSTRPVMNLFPRLYVRLISSHK